MNWDKFKHRFHPSWHHKIKPFIESKSCDDIYAFLKEEAKTKKIAPESVNTFRAFIETPYNELNAVIVGMCPYHSMIGSQYVADGLAFSCGITKQLQPSLELFYDAMEEEIYGGLNLRSPRQPDLTYLANQGVMLLNTALTTPIGEAGAHIMVWEEFMAYLMKECFNDTSVPIVFCGKDAEALKYYLPGDYPYFVVEHPAYAARQMRKWKTDGMFTYLDKKILDNNGKQIIWMDDDCPF